jgi:hypothetical protein
MSDLLKLAERCEAATGHSLDLDHEIGRALSTDGNYSYRPYTASLDAAMQLVPEGWYIGEWVESPDRDTSWITLVPAADEKVERTGKADTNPLALCAAALRARAAQETPLGRP